jgi:hypothetical protein
MSARGDRNTATAARQRTESRVATVARDVGARTLTVRVPMDLRRRGGRKLVVVPSDGAADSRTQRQPIAEMESPLVKLLARAFYWKCLFDSGEYASLENLAASENVDRSYLSKVLRLTLLAPTIVEEIVEGQESKQLTIEKLLAGMPVSWQQQMQTAASYI